MTFTDDDLKSLKEDAELDVWLDPRKVLPLFSRLEAAEKICLNIDKFWHDKRSFDGMLYAWRKACGVK